MVEHTLRIEDFLDDAEGRMEGDVPADQFLLDEGLDLLAAYRSISDQRIRKSVLDLVRMIAQCSSDNES